MKKTLLALAVSALSVNAFAANLDYSGATNPTPIVIATELSVPSTNTITSADALVWNLGFSITAGNKRYVRVNLAGGATFAGTPTLTFTAADGTAVAGVPASVISQGGTANDSFVMFEVTNNDAAVAVPANAKVVFTPGNLKITGKNNLTAAYSLYETAIDAVNQTNALAGKAAAPFISFASGLKTLVESVGTQKVIDVSAIPTSSKFKGALSTTTAKIGGVAVDVETNLVEYTTANPVTLGDLVAAGTKLVVTGDFSAAKTAGVLDKAKLFIDVDDSKAYNVGDIQASALTATTATFELDTTALGAVAASPTYASIYYSVDGTSPISPATYSAVYDVTANTAANTADVNLGQLSGLAKNGASEDVVVTMKPKSAGGFYTNVIRVTNKSGIEGDITITVINDNGERATVNLGSIAGQTSNTLKAGASTTQINVDDIFAAATGLSLAGQGKLRLVVDSTIPEDGLSVQSMVVSTDGSTLSRF
ncbi:hypothetical protein [Stutzerimonas kunmingensis]|uniref:hypothetical protein n=1 Tax=Stutzerimonas kunmingensis TaxID=1211807 RepID=UPI00241F4A00|nr:hypothetical protein [Stutzerimonas kunmingensis]